MNLITPANTGRPSIDAAAPVPGSLPLKIVRHERYCRYRALGAAPEQAAQRAGYPPRCGTWHRLEKRADVRGRISYLQRDEDARLLEHRQRILEELYLALDFDIKDFVLIDENSGEIVAIDWRKVRDSGVSKAINELTFDKDTGKLVKFRRDDRLNAVAQLRDMLGFRAPARNEVSGPDGGPVPTVNLNVTDEQRVAALMTILHKAESSNSDS